MSWVDDLASDVPPTSSGWVDELALDLEGPSSLDRWGMSESVGSNEEIGVFSSNLIDAVQAGAVDVAGGLGQLGASFFSDITRDDMQAWTEETQKRLEYEPVFTWDRVKEDWDEGGLAKIGESVAGFILEQGARSVVPMAMTLNPATFGAYVGSLIGNIGAERSRNDGREDTQIGDFVAAIPYAAGSALLERWGTSRLLKGTPTAQAKPGAAGFAKEVGTEVGKRAATEAGQEAVQESVQYLGETAGTVAGVDLEEMAVDRALAGAVAGGGMGATVGGAVGVSRRVARPKEGEVDDDVAQAREETETPPASEPAADSAKVEPDQAQAVAARTSPEEAAQPSVEEQADALVAQTEAEGALSEAARLRQAAVQRDNELFSLPPRPEPVAVVEQPPLTVEQPPLTTEQPPLTVEQPPLTTEVETPVSTVPTVSAPEPPARSYNEMQKEAAQLNRQLKAVGLTFPEGKRNRHTLEGLINQARGRLTEAEKARTERDSQASFEKFRGEAVADIQARSGTSYAASELLLRQTHDVLNRVVGRKQYQDLKEDADFLGRSLEPIRELADRRTDPDVAEVIFDAVNTVAPIISRLTDGQVNIQDAASYSEAVNAALTALDVYLPKKQRGKARVFVPPKSTAQVADKKPKARPVAQATPAEAARQALGFALDSALKRTSGPPGRISELQEIATDLRDAIEGMLTHRGAVSKDARELLQKAMREVDILEKGGRGVVVEPESTLPAARQPRKEGAPSIRRRLARASTLTAEALRARTESDAKLRRKSPTPEPEPADTGVQEAARAFLTRHFPDRRLSDELFDLANRPGRTPQNAAGVNRALGILHTAADSKTVDSDALARYLEDARKAVAEYTQTPPTDPTMSEMDTGQPYAQRMPDKPAAELQRRLTEVFNVPGLDGSGFVRELLRATQGFGRNDNVRRLRMLARLLSDLDLTHVTVRMDPDLGVRGDYDHRSDLVRLNPTILQDPERALQTALHEMVHAATVKQLHENNLAARRLLELQQYVDDVLRPAHYIGPKYGAADVYEFIAEGLANPAFQAQLNGLLLPVRLRRGGRLRSAWDALVDIVRTALGMEPRTHSALDAFLRDASELLTNEGLQAGRSHYYLRRTGYMPQADIDPRTGIRQGFRQVGRAAELQTDDPNILARTYAHARQGDKRGLKRDWKHWMQERRTRAALATIPRNEILKIYAKDFRDPDPGKKRKGTYLNDIVYHSRERYGMFRARQADKSPLMRRIEESLANSKAKTEAMFEMAHRATMAGLYPDRVWSAQDSVSRGREQGREALHTKLHAQYSAMSPKLKKLYQDIVKTMENDFNDRRAHMLVFTAKLQGIDADRTLTDIGEAKTVEDIRTLGLDEKAEASLIDVVNQFSQELPGVYFPLRRFGDYVVHGRREIKEDFATEAEALNRLDEFRNQFAGAQLYGPNERKDGRWHIQGAIPYMETAESQAQAEDIAADLRKTLGGEVQVGLKRDVELPADTPLRRLLELSDKETGDPEVTRAMRDALLSLLPESRQLRSALTRQYVEGYSKNMYRSLAQHFMTGDRAIAALAHSHEIATAFRNAQSHANRVEAAHDADRSIRMNRVIRELRERSTSEEDPETRPWARYVGQVAFLRYLTDIRYLVMNMAQPWMVGLPELGGVYGVDRTTRAMVRAYRIAMPRAWNHARTTKTQTLIGSLPGLDPSTFITDVKNDIRARDPDSEYIELINVAQNQEVLSSLQAEEMAAIGQGETRMDHFARLAAGPSQYVEFMNRLVMLISAYELEKTNNNPAQARLNAVDRVRDTQIDYSPGNRPRFMQRGLGRVWGTFKMFAFGMYSRLIEYTMRAWKGKTKKERQQGMAQLRLFLGTHTLAAGALGGLLIEPIRMAIYAAGLVLDDEDDFKEVWDNPDLWVREHLADMLGPEVGRWAATGVMPTSVGQSMGLGGLLVMQMPDTTDTATDLLTQVAKGVFGAPGQYVYNIGEGIVALNEEGDWNRFLAKTVPFKAATNMVKAIDLHNEGITDRQGNTLISEKDVGWGEVLLQSLGVAPGVVNEIYAARDVKYSREKPAAERAKLLRKNYYNAKGADRIAAWNAIRTFNRQNPAHRVTYASLRRGMQRRRTQRMETRRGVYFRGDDLQRYYNPQTVFAQVP